MVDFSTQVGGAGHSCGRDEVLLIADWKAWFDERTGVPKTHRGNVWWSSLLVCLQRAL